MALHVGHNCVPWGDCDVCGAKVEPQYRQRTDVCAMCGAGFTVCRCRHQLREWRESMSVLDGPGEGTWSVFAQKVVEQRDRAIEERDEALRLLATRVEAKRLDEAQEEIERLRETLQALVDEKLVCNVREGDGSYIDVSAWCQAVLNGEKP